MKIKLPEPKTTGSISVEETLLKRRSVREYLSEHLSLAEISQLLWSAYGITSEEGFRTAPSAGALFPLKIYLAAVNINKLEQGFYLYDSKTHTLELRKTGDYAEPLTAGTFFQDYIGEAAAILIISADYTGPNEKYGDQGKKFTWMDLGHLGQNVHLQAVSLDIGTVAVAAVRPDEIEKLLDLPGGEEVLYLMPLGKTSY
jgi:SagB-type dehydrogenase family enzyme